MADEELKAPTSEELAAGLSGKDMPGAPEGEPTKPVIEGQPPVEGAEPPIQSEGPKLSYQGLWDKMKADGATIPDKYLQGDFGDIDEFTALRETILENTEDEEDDPFLQQLRSIPPDQRSEYIRNYNAQMEFFQLEPTDGITAWYQSVRNEKGERRYSDEDITKYLDGKSAIEVDREWDGIKQQAEQYRQQSFKAPDETQKVARIETVNKERSVQAQTIAGEIDTMTEFAGVPLTDDVKAAAKKNFELLTKLNPKTGKPYILNLLADNAKLRNVVLAMTVTDGDHIKKFLSGFKEDFKEEILDKLDTNPKPKGGAAPNITAAPKPSDFV